MKQNNSCKKIGILGGSFDPIHQGHLNIALNAQKEFGLDEVWFIPAGHSPNKDESGMTPAEMRAEMVALAIESYPTFRLSRIEIDAAETSYTYLTLTKLTELYPDKQFFFIMGADSLDYFDKWRYPEIICHKAVILTAVRDDMDIAEIQQKINALKKLFHAEIYPVQGGRTDISSTEIRRAAAADETKPVMIPVSVWKYIKEKQLYCDTKQKWNKLWN